MANVSHSTLEDPYLHEPKGVKTADEGKVYVADSGTSGNWHFLPMGWGHYKDNAGTQVFNTTPTKLSIDGAGSTTETGYLPFAIRTSGALWDTTADKITPINIGDSYNVRLDLPVTAEAGSPTELTMELDIAGSVYASRISIVTRYQGTGKATPYTITMGFPIFCLTTFKTNGGQFWLYTDTGSVTITNPAIFLDMNTNGAI